MPSQSPQFAEQLATAQAEETHLGVALASVHGRLHPPQLAVLLVVLTSHPSLTVLLQSAKPVLHAAMVQLPPAQPGDALASEQALVHEPQCAASFSRLTSHPFDATVSQLAKFVLQVATAHTDPEQVDVALARLHALPQPPQLAALVVVFTSQPSLGVWLQSANPVAHPAMTQLEALHAGVALASEHALPQVPQFAVLLVVFTSQPSEGILLQSEYPAAHVATPHAELTHLGVALARLHAPPHAPQLFGSLVVSTQLAPLQRVGVALGQPDVHA
jgi:hypothetical protein